MCMMINCNFTLSVRELGEFIVYLNSYLYMFAFRHDPRLRQGEKSRVSKNGTKWKWGEKGASNAKTNIKIFAK